jgi:hypothetical protein
MNSTLKSLAALGILVSLFGDTALADLEVRRVVVLERSPSDATLRFIVVHTPEEGTTMQLWRGDYLWESCRTLQLSHPVRTVKCGEHRLEWDSARQTISWSETSSTSQNG